MSRSYPGLLSSVWARKGMGRVSWLGSLPKFTGDLELEWSWRDWLFRHKVQSPAPHSFTWLPLQSSLICPKVGSVRDTVRQAGGMGNRLECGGEKVKQKALGKCSANLRTVLGYNEGILWEMKAWGFEILWWAQIFLPLFVGWKGADNWIFFLCIVHQYPFTPFEMSKLITRSNRKPRASRYLSERRPVNPLDVPDHLDFLGNHL